MDPHSAVTHDPNSNGFLQPKNEAPSNGRENFVSKLYQMLETPQFAGIVSWNSTDQGPSFIIMDTARFQDQILVNEFNHANFSSFVRQLNKYDFHKVKFRDPHSRVWEFRHPLFRPENRDKAYLIKRKQQSSNKKGKATANNSKDQAEVVAKAAELAMKDTEDTLKGQYTDLESRLYRLERNYSELLGAFRLQQSLVERLCNHINLPDFNDNINDNTMSHDRPIMGTPNIDVNGYPHVSGAGGVHQLNLTPQQQQTPPHVEHHTPMSSDISPAMGGTPIGDFSFATNLRALVAIDDPKVREILIKILVKFGFSVDSVDNGVDVVRRVESISYNYILIDSILKLLDGLSAVILIRQMNIYTPILLLCDSLTKEEEAEALQKGTSAVLYRPFSQTDLYNELKRFSPNA